MIFLYLILFFFMVICVISCVLLFANLFSLKNSHHWQEFLGRHLFLFCFLWQVLLVDELDSGDAANLALLDREQNPQSV